MIEQSIVHLPDLIKDIDRPVSIYLMHLSSFASATATRNGLDDLDLFTGTGVLDKMRDVDDALEAGVGALEAGVMRLYGVVVIVSGWVRVGCARLCVGHEAPSSWSVPRGVSPPPGLPTCQHLKWLILLTFAQGILYTTSKINAEVQMERIRQLRKERGLSQVKLAVMADMDPATLNRLERGTGNPNLKTLERVADVLGVEVADFFPKAQSLSPEPSFDDEQRAAWEATVVEGRRLRETGRAQMW